MGKLPASHLEVIICIGSAEVWRAAMVPEVNRVYSLITPL